MKFFLLLLISASNFAFAQQKRDQILWHLTVIDSDTMKGIVNATVSINKTQYYITNSNGVADINRNLLNPNARISVTCIGYKSNAILLSSGFEYPDTIRLSSSIIALNEVKINTATLAEIKIGDFKRSYNVHRITSPSCTYAQFIPNDKNIKGTITSVEYVLNDKLHGIEMPFRVRLFTKMKDSLTLDEELTSDSIIVYNPEKKRRVMVDISKYNIQLPQNGVIVTFEMLSASYYGKDSIWYNGYKYAKTPGIDMDVTKNYERPDNEKVDRRVPYAMVGPKADNWNLDDTYDQWYVYAEGNNFAITLTIGK